MTARGSIATTALGWVREDLDKLLGHIRLQVEHLAAEPNVAEEILLESSEKLEQLNLTLQALVLPGPVMLTGEMLTLGQRIGQRRVGNREAAFQAMMEALVVLPSYLDRLQAGHHDLPMLLLPAVNKLRGAYNSALLPEEALFTPDLDVELPELEAVGSHKATKEPLADLAMRMRGQFETALLNWLEEQQSTELLAPLQGVCETLVHRLQRVDLRRLWWIASEVIAGLADGHIENDVYLRRLLARVHLNLKHISEEGEDAVDKASADALARAFLHPVSKSRRATGGLAVLRKRFQLDTLVPDQEELIRARGAVTGQNREMYTSLGAAVQDELLLVKDALDLELRTGEIDPERRAESSAALRRLADTLQILGLAETAKSFGALLPEFEQTADADAAFREASLMSLAERLLQVESILNEQIETLGEPLLADDETGHIDLPTHEQRRIVSQALDETVASLQQFQETIKARLGGNGSVELEPPIYEVIGALRLIGDNDMAALTDRLRHVTGEMFEDVTSESAVPRSKLELFTDAVAALELYLAAYRDQQESRGHFAGIYRQRVDALESAEVEAADSAPVGVRPEQAGHPPAETPSEPKIAAAHAPEPAAREPDILDPELLEVFLEEYETVSETLQQNLPEWLRKLDDAAPLTEVRRCFHTLKGSGRMVGAFELGDFAWQVEDMLNALLDARIGSFADAAVTVRLAQAALPALKQRLMQQPAGLSPEAVSAIGRHAESISRDEPCDWDGLREVLPGFLASMLPESSKAEAAPEEDEDELRRVMRKEFADNLLHLQDLLESVSADRKTRTSADQVRAVHTIAGALSLQPAGRDAEVAKALEGMLEAQSQSGGAFSDESVWTLASTLGHLQTRMDQLGSDAGLEPAGNEQELIDQLIELTVQFEAAEPAVVEPPPEEAVEEPEDALPAGETDEPLPAQTDVAPAAPAEAEAERIGLDADIVQIFLEESREVLARSDSLLNDWRDNLDDMQIVQNLQRELHTFKGGARMAGLTGLGDISHAMESLMERISGAKLRASVSAVKVLEDACDRLLGWIEEVSQGSNPDTSEFLELFDQQVQTLADVTAEPLIQPKVEAPEADREVKEIPDAEAPVAEKARDASGRSYVRVDADLLDSLVNSAGEINVFRSRLERQTEHLRNNLDEFNKTVIRLREQFRKLEIETETQIRSRYHDTAEDGTEGFDPLELDRFSSMQQLSRGLSESVADLLNLQEMLDDAARQSESILAKQARVGTELQEGLMQTRMVPFGSIAPRLRRLVRTASKETGKQARLALRMAGGSDQLDRNVLERVTAPLEHMLRNSIVHGIEHPSQRLQLGKQPEGQITITVESEATEFVIRIADDGAGINLDAIRKQAIERGMLEPDADPPTAQLLEFILHSGFTTSDTITGLAGRGVGMDVVNSEIKQIGGSLEIASETGQGTTITVRIPFTLAVMQAIGVMAGEQRYLLPLSSVAGVARLLPDDYTALLESETPVYEFGGEAFPVLELERVLGEPQHAIGSENVSLLMVRAGDQQAAFQVPQILGHREIVIKPVGPQINSVPGILGGTVGGDGRVVVILDPGPLIRHAIIHGNRPTMERVQPEAASRQLLAMVVDDSITMRKVTSRVLESHDFEVITARDGIEATEQMQERTPDLLLLDIEMPRMDGYAVAEHVRADARLRHIPIMMITSRSGQKHRDRAARAGADAYLTKPYKEIELVAEVKKLLGQGNR